jgi:hypothetical protein
MIDDQEITIGGQPGGNLLGFEAGAAFQFQPTGFGPDQVLYQFDGSGPDGQGTVPAPAIQLAGDGGATDGVSTANFRGSIESEYRRRSLGFD